MELNVTVETTKLRQKIIQAVNESRLATGIAENVLASVLADIRAQELIELDQYYRKAQEGEGDGTVREV